MNQRALCLLRAMVERVPPHSGAILHLVVARFSLLGRACLRLHGFIRPSSNPLVTTEAGV